MKKAFAFVPAFVLSLIITSCASAQNMNSNHMDHHGGTAVSGPSVESEAHVGRIADYCELLRGEAIAQRNVSSGLRAYELRASLPGHLRRIHNVVIVGMHNHNCSRPLV